MMAPSAPASASALQVLDAATRRHCRSRSAVRPLLASVSTFGPLRTPSRAMSVYRPALDARLVPDARTESGRVRDPDTFIQPCAATRAAARVDRRRSAARGRSAAASRSDLHRRRSTARVPTTTRSAPASSSAARLLQRAHATAHLDGDPDRWRSARVDQRARWRARRRARRPGRRRAGAARPGPASGAPWPAGSSP